MAAQGSTTAGGDAWTRFAVPVVGVLRGAVVGVATQALAVLVLIAAGLVPVLGLGVPVLLELAGLVRRLAERQRSWAAGVLGVASADPHTPWPDGPSWRRLRVLVGEAATWRDLAWLWWQSVVAPLCLLGVAIPVLVAYAVLVDGSGGVGWMYVALTPVALVALGLGVLVAGPFHRLQAVVSHRLLSRSEGTSAAARIDELTRTRARSVDAAATELRRIERDLHDGVQARLVALGLSVGLARTEVRRAPERADDLLAGVGRDVGAALEELRALVRGIHPPVLAERGLASALEALALGAAVPVRTRIQVVDRFDAPVESAVYFAVAESLTNVSRHAGASRADLAAHHDGDRLHVRVTDDGRGGADPARGSGLRGIADRLAAFDGTTAVSSPDGGPTTIDLEVPCAPSSPRTRPCSETGSPGSSPPTTSP